MGITEICNYINIWQKESLVNIKNNYFIGFFGGEPLLNILLIKRIVKYLELHCPPNIVLNYSMTTNGILLVKHIAFLVKKSFSLSVSLDGDRKGNQHRIFRNGKESFDLVYNNLKIIQKQYPDFFKRSILLLSVLHNNNSVKGVYNYFAKEFKKEPKIGELSPLEIKDTVLMKKIYKSSSQESLKNRKSVSLVTSQDWRAVENFIKNFSGNYISQYISLLDNEHTMRMLPTGTCIPFQNKIYIAADGKVFPCEKIGYRYPLGKINSTGIIFDVAKTVNLYNRM